MRIDSDYLIIGTGAAGLYFALQAAERGSVSLVTKKGASESNTRYAQGGIASVIGSGDSEESHVQDTLASGAGLSQREAVELTVQEGPRAIQNLIRLDTRFSMEENGSLSLGREGGHSHNRIVHADDLTGRELSRSLLEAAGSQGRIALHEHHLGIDLLMESGKTRRCHGVQALDASTGEIVEFCAPVTLLATGGAGQIFDSTTNPSVATGDGVAMAYRAGATVGNMEFYQFHPTALWHPRGNTFLITEALRGYGAVLVNHQGEAFVEARVPGGSLATRDVVVRAIVSEMKESGEPCVYLDVTRKVGGETRRRFPNISRFLMELGIDITRQPIPVAPAAHYMCGGIRTDLKGQTDVPGLYAAGEVALTGFHGANRLASNSLLEALVFGRRALEHAATNRNGTPMPSGSSSSLSTVDAAESVDEEACNQLRRTMLDNVGIVRHRVGLDQACATVDEIARKVEGQQRAIGNPAWVELRNMTTVAQLVAHSARMREESRGVHYREDFPDRDDSRWQHDSLLRMSPEDMAITDAA
ncbi:MAG: L-aspartate oxidase [Candidatus Latescibacterota bacterium]|nr:L-aspartate oxidase [Candidatus Latescibacterota bacterium]